MNGTGQENIKLRGYEAAGNINPVGIYTWNTGSLSWVKQVPISASGGGGAATIADGADVAEGATTDAAVITDTTGTLSGKIRGLVKWAFERMPASLGQKVMASSFPVVISSDQTVIPVSNAGLSNIDVLLSTRLKPADTLAALTNLVQFNGSPIVLGSGVRTAGTLRVTVATDDLVPVSGTVAVSTIAGAITPGTGIANLGKAEDAASASGDTGVFVLCVRNDLDATLASADLDYAAPVVDLAGRVKTREGAQLIATALSAANAGVTLTIAAAGAGLFHYITSVEIVAVNPTVTAIAAAATTLAFTSTNIPGAPAWTAGTLLAAGAEKLIERIAYPGGIKTTTANTATTFVAPAIGAGGLCRIIVTYYIAP